MEAKVGLRAELAARSAHATTDLVAMVLAISRIPYGRPTSPSPEAVLREWRGTCSTKHLLLAEIMRESWPELDVQLRHRVYFVTKAFASERWGPRLAEMIPEGGLVDVHTYATVRHGGVRLTLDVTFPLDDWDGATPIPLACADGVDHPVASDPLAEKARLVATYCNPEVREPFIAALSEVQGP
jgi:hypothetical protein